AGPAHPSNHAKPSSNLSPVQAFQFKREQKKYTSIGEPYSSILENLIKANAITLPPIKPHTGFDPSRPIP
ncbi:hypothetical protein KI387_042854, partial [Taxus chinensis]